MSKDAARWSLEGLIDFESEVAADSPTPGELRGEVARAARGLDGGAARRAGFAVWLAGVGASGVGRRFSGALSLVGGGLAALMFLAGVSAVLGLLDREKGGVPVSLFAGVLIGGQWLVLLLAGAGWLFRGRAAEGFSLVQVLVAKLAKRVAGDREAAWWERLMQEGGAARAAVLWRLARLAQAAGVAFNMGVLGGLGGLVLVRHVGFFWETSTEMAMHTVLEKAVALLSWPWAAWWPGAVPDAAVIDATQWVPEAELPPGPAGWWQFLLMAVLVWGLLPRVLLWVGAWWAQRRALGRLDFQARSHRALWRDLTGSARAEPDDKPLDGVLVLDVGGSGLAAEALRPFLLRRMRVHPAAWQPVAVMDEGAEGEAAKALANAPAGVVLLAEGWSLSPPRMSAMHQRVRAKAGVRTPVKFLVANSEAGGLPVGPTDEERREWEKFVDSLRDPEAEVFFYEGDG